MFKKILLLSLLVCTLYAEETFSVEDFEATLFSKVAKNKTANIQTSIIFEGRDVDIYDFKITDALNIVIGSFYAEDLLTSQGKETFKNTMIKYVRKNYSIDIDYMYIQKLRILDNSSAKDIVKILQEEGYIKR